MKFAFSCRIDARRSRENRHTTRETTVIRLDTVIINEYQATSSIAADINVTQNPESIIHRPSWRFHHCLHFRPVRKGSIPWNIGCVGLADYSQSSSSIAFHSASILPFSLSLPTSLCPSHYRS